MESWRVVAKDYLYHLINSFLVLPYLVATKIGLTLNKFGWDGLSKKLKSFKPGLSTSDELAFEKMIRDDFLLSGPGYHKLTTAVRYMPHIEESVHSQLRQGVHDWSDRRARWVDLSSSLILWGVGLIIFDDNRLGLMSFGENFASWWMFEQSISDFPLGEDLGSVFYSVFPPEPSNTEIWVCTFIVMVAVSSLTFLLSFVLNPIQKKLGFQEHFLHSLLSSLETKLILTTRRSKNDLEKMVS